MLFGSSSAIHVVGCRPISAIPLLSAVLISYSCPYEMRVESYTSAVRSGYRSRALRRSESTIEAPASILKLEFFFHKLLNDHNHRFSIRKHAICARKDRCFEINRKKHSSVACTLFTHIDHLFERFHLMFEPEPANRRF